VITSFTVYFITFSKQYSVILWNNYTCILYSRLCVVGYTPKSRKKETENLQF